MLGLYYSYYITEVIYIQNYQTHVSELGAIEGSEQLFGKLITVLCFLFLCSYYQGSQHTASAPVLPPANGFYWSTTSKHDEMKRN